LELRISDPQNSTDKPTTLSATEARQGRRDKPVLMVLIASLAITVVAAGIGLAVSG